jgi:rhodanese-related sulfurtransferase
MSENGITRDELARNSRKAVLVDVRSADEFAAGSVPGATNVLPDALGSLTVPEGALVVTICNHGGSRSQGAAKSLRERGVDAKYLEGGVKGPKAGH